MNEQNVDIERLLKQVRLEGPSAKLKERVVGTAGRAWNETPAGVSWQVPLRRLAACAVAAVLMVAMTDFCSDRAVARWQYSEPVVAKMIPADFDELPEGSYGPFVRHLAAARRSSVRDATALLNYLEKTRETFSGAEENGASEAPAPAEGRSRLLLDDHRETHA